VFSQLDNATPLMIFARLGESDIVDSLLKSAKQAGDETLNEMMARRDKHGWTALHYCALQSKEKVVAAFRLHNYVTVLKDHLEKRTHPFALRDPPLSPWMGCPDDLRGTAMIFAKRGLTPAEVASLSSNVRMKNLLNPWWFHRMAIDRRPAGVIFAPPSGAAASSSSGAAASSSAAAASSSGAGPETIVLSDSDDEEEEVGEVPAPPSEDEDFEVGEQRTAVEASAERERAAAARGLVIDLE
jgi:hypothetical protein